MSAPATVFIVDDDPAACESVAALVQTMGLASETFSSAEEFLALCDKSRPGCLVADVRMPGMGGLKLQDTLRAQNIHLPIIIITGYADIPMTVRVMKQGAVTLLEKPCRDQELRESITRAVETDAEVRRQHETREAIRSRMAELTEPERRVMNLMMNGLTNKVIAQRLDIGLRTVEKHRHNVLKKLHADSLPDLVRLVLQARDGDLFDEFAAAG